jgi:hypothetical protein
MSWGRISGVVLKLHRFDRGEWTRSPPDKDAAYPLNAEPNSECEYVLNKMKVSKWLTPCGRILLKKLTTASLVKKLPAFYGTLSSLPYSQ